MIGPFGTTPRKAAVLVLTPAIGLMLDGTSSTYTPGDKYSGMLICSFVLKLALGRQSFVGFKKLGFCFLAPAPVAPPLEAQ
jgi:hypothetical protein